MAKKEKKGKIRGTMSWLFKPFFNVSGWMSLSILKITTVGVIESAKNVLSPEQAGRSETFEEAVQRLNLSDAKLLQTQKLFVRFALTFLFLSLLTIVYTLYLLWNAHFAAGILSLIIACIFGTYAFRYHFWYFQIQHRKLGCSFQEWFNAKISGEKG